MEAKQYIPTAADVIINELELPRTIGSCDINVLDTNTQRNTMRVRHNSIDRCYKMLKHVFNSPDILYRVCNRVVCFRVVVPDYTAISVTQMNSAIERCTEVLRTNHFGLVKDELFPDKPRDGADVVVLAFWHQ